MRCRRTIAEWEDWAGAMYQLAGDLTSGSERPWAERDSLRELLLDNLADPWDMAAEEIATEHKRAVARGYVVTITTAGGRVER